MKYEEKFRRHLDFVWAKDHHELKRCLDRGDYIGEAREAVEAFLKEKQNEATERYLLSPDYSALRAASAAEKSNKLMEEANATARSAMRVAVFAVLVAVVALAAQVFGIKL